MLHYKCNRKIRYLTDGWKRYPHIREPLECSDPFTGDVITGRAADRTNNIATKPEDEHDSYDIRQYDCSDLVDQTR